MLGANPSLEYTGVIIGLALEQSENKSKKMSGENKYRKGIEVFTHKIKHLPIWWVLFYIVTKQHLYAEVR